MRCKSKFRLPTVSAVLLFAALGTGCPKANAQSAPGSPPTSPKTGQASTQKLRNPLIDLLAEAQAALDKNDFEAALAPLQKFNQEKPDVAYVHFQLAYAYTQLKRDSDARTEYERAIALDPKLFEAFLNLGTLLLESNPKEAVVALKKAVELQPTQNHPRYLLAVALDHSGDTAGATAEFEKLLALEPNNREAMVYVAWSLLHAKQSDLAEAKFRHVLELEPKDSGALLGLAQSLEQQNKPETAEAYRNYLATKPGDNTSRTRLINFLIARKQYEAALAEVEKSPDANPPTADTLRLRADVQMAQKKPDDAIASLKQAIVLVPQDATLHGGIGRLYLQQRDFVNAEKELKVAVQLDPKNVNNWKDLGATYYLAGNYPSALAVMDQTAKLETPNAGAWFIRALCYDKLRAAKPALDAYRKFLELDQNQNTDQVWQANQRIHVLEKMVGNKPK